MKGGVGGSGLEFVRESEDTPSPPEDTEEFR
jgi:hypothetical protein